MYFFYHRFEFVTLFDDGAKPLGLFGEVRHRFWLDADGVLGVELLLRGFELPLAAQLRKAAGLATRLHARQARALYEQVPCGFSTRGD